MKNGFYSIRQAGADQNPADHDAWGLAMLAHLKDGRTIGVDQGGCKVGGTYSVRSDGAVVMQIVYELRCGSHLPDGRVLASDLVIERELELQPETTAGGHQLIDVGLGPMFISFEWLAEAA